MLDIDCYVMDMFKDLGKEWMVLLFCKIVSDGPLTYKELRTSANGTISPSLLSTRLKRMQKLGLIQRCKCDGRMKYCCTESGRQLMEKLVSLKDWAVESGICSSDDCPKRMKDLGDCVRQS